MRLKIVGDGTALGTDVQVLDDDGNQVGSLAVVTDLTYTAGITRNNRLIAKAILTVVDVQVDLEHDVTLTAEGDQRPRPGGNE